MDNYFGDDSRDFLNNNSDSSSGVSEIGSNYSGGILEVYKSPDAKSAARKSFETQKFLAKMEEKSINKRSTAVHIVVLGRSVCSVTAHLATTKFMQIF
jgi:hypothetical protein